MTGLTELIQQGGLAPWLLLPSAAALGALHGLEPGHAKSMMAAFIIAVRGTIPQAIVLGLSAMVSHTLVIWVLAAMALAWGDGFIGEHSEPIFMVASGVIVIALASWMLIQTWRQGHAGSSSRHHREHHHDHDHGHHRGHDHGHHHDHGHGHDYGHDHAAVDAGDHARRHARQIEDRFGDRRVTTAQVMLFGLSGGLLPCSAAIAVLLICLQLDQFALGMAMVGAFSVGLAVVLIGVGVIAAWGAARASRRFAWIMNLSRRLPYLSGAVVLGLGVVMIASGWAHWGDGHAHATGGL